LLYSCHYIVYTLSDVIVSSLSSKTVTSSNNCCPAILQSVTGIAPSVVATVADDKRPANVVKAPNISKNKSYVLSPNNTGSVG
jgi:hypothetical protein